MAITSVELLLKVELVIKFESESHSKYADKQKSALIKRMTSKCMSRVRCPRNTRSSSSCLSFLVLDCSEE